MAKAGRPPHAPLSRRTAPRLHLRDDLSELAQAIGTMNMNISGD